MSEELEQNEEELLDAIPESISNLAIAFSSLSEIDSSLLSNARKAKLARMKRQVFDALVYYCEHLPELLEDEKNKED